ncbi:phage repressor protein C with HTH and peptisase S24 domain [Chryseobacterium sp. 7]|uniref:LexA family transcriptional regulator n=1 Tax=Chryseobacterium sp. 7 TaxID=2035214 RepID=UPI000EAEE4E6|nr:LexA family transcriptional regulator [Chryseobacterium sp. 7]RLJ33885.1 phage repressor protein C with HTH and peptisase S24 domain [Chryseobacterium sp. 7]
MKEKTNNNQKGSYLRRFLELNSITPKMVQDALGVSQQYVSAIINGSKSIGKGTAKKLNELYGADEYKLLFGEGSMLNEPEKKDNIKLVSPDNIDKLPSNRKTFDTPIEIQTIPVYDSTATLGLVEVFNGSETGNILSYISIPNLPKSDGAIFMTGDSMYPLLKSGDIVALKIINRLDIIYGEMYYVEYLGEDEYSEFKVIKYVKKSELGKDYIQLASYNQHHEPKDILLSKIKTIAIVNASVRYNRL